MAALPLGRKGSYGASISAVAGLRKKPGNGADFGAGERLLSAENQSAVRGWVAGDDAGCIERRCGCRRFVLEWGDGCIRQLQQSSDKFGNLTAGRCSIRFGCMIEQAVFPGVTQISRGPMCLCCIRLYRASSRKQKQLQRFAIAGSRLRAEAAVRVALYQSGFCQRGKIRLVPAAGLHIPIDNLIACWRRDEGDLPRSCCLRCRLLCWQRRRQIGHRVLRQDIQRSWLADDMIIRMDRAGQDDIRVDAHLWLNGQSICIMQGDGERIAIHQFAAGQAPALFLIQCRQTAAITGRMIGSRDRDQARFDDKSRAAAAAGGRTVKCGGQTINTAVYWRRGGGAIARIAFTQPGIGPVAGCRIQTFNRSQFCFGQRLHIPVIGTVEALGKADCRADILLFPCWPQLTKQDGARCFAAEIGPAYHLRLFLAQAK